MNDNNDLVENIVILDAVSPPVDSPWLLPASMPPGDVVQRWANSSLIKKDATSPAVVKRMTSSQIKKEITCRLEERTRLMIEKTSAISRKNVKCSETDFVIPSVNDHSAFLSYKYKKCQLQTIARHYRLIVSGSVSDLTVRVYSYLTSHAHVQPFQSLWRGYLRRKCNMLRGPAFMNRSLCNNDEDFLTGETMNEVSADQFSSYTTSDGFVYGFDIISLYNLKSKSNTKNVLNPYTREPIPMSVFVDLNILIRISNSVYDSSIDVSFDMPVAASSGDMSIEERVVELFDSIASHGYYPTIDWFMELERRDLIKMLRELSDIFLYRASIPRDIQVRICPINPFRSMSTMVDIMQSYEDILVSRDILLYVASSVVMSGVATTDRALGTIVFLQALTLVSNGARDSYPLFYESAVYD